MGPGPLAAWGVLGFAVGLVARWVVPGDAPGGILGDIVVGIIGAIAGGWLYNHFGNISAAAFNLPSAICALIGAVVLLWILRGITGRPTV